MWSVFAGIMLDWLMVKRGDDVAGIAAMGSENWPRTSVWHCQQLSGSGVALIAERKPSIAAAPRAMSVYPEKSA